MGVTLQHEEGNVRALRVAGVLKKAEFDAVLTAEAKQWAPQTHVKVLVLAEGFQGWERNEEWGDLSFFLTYGDRIDKIAIVADPKWEDDLLMFAASGFRRAPVKFFASGRVTQAREWLVEK
jgi:hypothetical protein